MSQSPHYLFLPWLRRGIAGQISRVDSGASQPASAMKVTVELNDAALSASVNIGVFGPGEVTGFDPRCVLRCGPTAGAPSADTSTLAVVEFAEPDFPWRFTPARANSQDQLRPWICLALLKDTEIANFTPSGGEDRLPVVSIKSASVLPSNQETWAWAHVQVSGAQSMTSTQAGELMGSEPERFLSRLLSPCALELRTQYLACIIPVFERGRLAGLRQPVPSDLDALTPAWSGSGPLDLPVYFSWKFQTGEGENFESMVRRLEPHPLPTGTGSRPMEAPGASSTPLGLEGALQAPGATSTSWDAVERKQFTDRLRSILNRPQEAMSAPGAPRVVAPPLYGQWLAAKPRLDPGAGPAWFEELNTDPRYRVAAGLGTLVVQREQQGLMAAAWEQVDQVRDTNEQLRFGQLSREVASNVHKRRVSSASTETVLRLTAPMHRLVRAGTAAIADTLAASPAPGAVLDPQFRRIARGRGPLGRRLKLAERKQGGLLDRLNRGQLVVARPRATSSAMASFAHAVAKSPGLDKKLAALQPSPTPASKTFLEAAARILTRKSRPVKPAAKPADLESIRRTLLAQLDPVAWINQSWKRRLKSNSDFKPKDPLEPVMDYPQFDHAMYEPLASISPQWLMPGLEGLPPNSVSMAKTNRRFVEAYMIGLNHEMARELLWNEYPTDQRGTCFQRFWGMSPDIPPVPAWSKTKPLGENSNGVEPVVLVVCGELTRRFPNARFYAVKAVVRNGKRELSASPADERLPIFSGRLEPEIAFVGFDLTVEDTSAEPGWFFVIQEPGEEAQFRWTESRLPATRASDAAAIMLRRPLRVAVHASRLLVREDNG